MVRFLDALVWLQQDMGLENLVTETVNKFLPLTIAEYKERSFALAQVVRGTSLEVEEPSEPAKREAYLKEVLETYTERWLERSKHHLGYPVNMDFDYSDLGCLNRFAINNIGDPFIDGCYGVHSRDFEVGVLDWFARFWDIKLNEYWGYITNGGSEGNLHGLLLGRQVFPNGILYTSEETHYSVFKAAYILRINVVLVKALTSGEIDCDDLKVHLLRNKDKPAILNINIGTTVKGAIDDLDLTIMTLEACGFPRDRFYIHCDGALSSIMLPFQDQVPRITFKKPIDSISVSGHKFVGCPIPCGVQIARIEHIRELSKDHEYIASRDATITGSRNGHTPIFLWYALNRKGHKGLQKDVQQCLHNAKYLKDRLKDIRVSAMLNEASIIVVFERPQDEEFIRRWQLACRGNIAHVCVMPNVTIEKINTFLIELIAKRFIWYITGVKQPPCVASDIGKENCECRACRG